MKYKFTKTVYFESSLPFDDLVDLSDTDTVIFDALIDRQEYRTSTEFEPVTDSQET